MLSLAMGPFSLLRMGSPIQHRHQDLLEECSDSVSHWISMGPNLSPIPKTPGYDWMCNPVASTMLRCVHNLLFSLLVSP